MPNATDPGADAVAAILELAGLSLDPERLSQLLPSFRALRQDMARLEGVAPTEIEPANTFSPGEEE